jgi:hypothetical protein
MQLDQFNREWFELLVTAAESIVVETLSGKFSS